MIRKSLPVENEFIKVLVLNYTISKRMKGSQHNTVETHQTQPGFYKDLGKLFKRLSKVPLHTFEVCEHAPTLTPVEKYPNAQTPKPRIMR